MFRFMEKITKVFWRGVGWGRVRVRNKTSINKYHWSKVVAGDTRMSKMSFTFPLYSAYMKSRRPCLGSRLLEKTKTGGERIIVYSKQALQVWSSCDGSSCSQDPILSRSEWSGVCSFLSSWCMSAVCVGWGRKVKNKFYIVFILVDECLIR